MRKLLTIAGAAAILASSLAAGAGQAAADTYNPHPGINTNVKNWHEAPLPVSQHPGWGHYRNPGWGDHRAGNGYFQPGWGYYSYDPGWGSFGAGSTGFLTALTHPYGTPPAQSSAAADHRRACESHHPSYNPRTNTYMTYSGQAKVCTL